MAWLKRILLALAGGAIGSFVVALAEANAASQSSVGSSAPRYWSLVMADAAVLGPLSLGLAFAVAWATIFLEPERARSISEHLGRLRALPVFRRSRTAAAIPLGAIVLTAWCVSSAHVARRVLADGDPVPSGLGLA